MPPKQDEAAKPKKVKEVPKVPCRCGANMYRAPPKGKKLSPQPEHVAGCTFQRAPCNRYPHLPVCSNCEEVCQYCCQSNPWCNFCGENKCKFMYQRDVLGWAKLPSSGGAADIVAGSVAGTPPSTAPAGGPKKGV